MRFSTGVSGLRRTPLLNTGGEVTLWTPSIDLAPGDKISLGSGSSTAQTFGNSPATHTSNTCYTPVECSLRFHASTHVAFAVAGAKQRREVLADSAKPTVIPPSAIDVSDSECSPEISPTVHCRRKNPLAALPDNDKQHLQACRLTRSKRDAV